MKIFITSVIIICLVASGAITLYYLPSFALIVLAVLLIICLLLILKEVKSLKRSEIKEENVTANIFGNIGSEN